MRTYLTEYEDLGRTMAGPNIQAENWSAAEMKLEAMRLFGMVAPDAHVIGELVEEIAA